MTLYTYRATVKRVVDGDTVELDVDLGFHVHLVRIVRLRGVNAPEVRGDTKLLGLAARAHLHELTQYRPLTAQTYLDRQDKYGRILVELFDGDTNINQRMVLDGHAVPYPLEEVPA